MELGEKLIELRRAKGWTQDELARELGISRQAVSKWGRGVAKGGEAPIWHYTLRSKV